jgi:hypothetical protein
MSDMTFFIIGNAVFALGAIGAIIPLFIINRKG